MHLYYRSKLILTFIIGVIIGFILCAAVSIYVSQRIVGNSSNGTNVTSEKEKTNDNNDVKIFDKPQNEIPVRTFKVIQVFTDGPALATAESHDTPSEYFGLVVFF